MYSQRELLELLERKYSLVADITNPAEFLLELSGFLEFVQSDRQLKFYSDQMVSDYQRRIPERDRAFEEQEQKTIELRHRLAEICPDLDDSDMELGSSDEQSLEYFYSLGYFDKLVREPDVQPSGSKTWPIGLNLYEDDSKVTKLLQILERKLGSKEWQDCCLQGEEIDNRCEVLYSDVRHLCDEHLYTHRYFVNCCRISPGFSLELLKNLIHFINPSPSRTATMSDYFHQVIERILLPEGRLQTAIQGTVYGKGIGSGFIKPVEVDYSILKLHLRRIYEGLRALIGSQLAFHRVVEQYKTRCENYERIELVQLVEDHITVQSNEGKRIQLEDLLTRHLALYLYDNGYPVHYRLRAGGQEPDLVSTGEAPEHIVIEAKVVGRGQGKEWIWKGLRALHSYLEKCHSEIGVTDGYLIVFRVGDGEMFSFVPHRWQIGYFQIVPRLINLGGTSKEKDPTIMHQEEWTTCS
jgi:hypothetical protein